MRILIKRQGLSGPLEMCFGARRDHYSCIDDLFADLKKVLTRDIEAGCIVNVDVEFIRISDWHQSDPGYINSAAPLDWRETRG